MGIGRYWTSATRSARNFIRSTPRSSSNTSGNWRNRANSKSSAADMLKKWAVLAIIGACLATIGVAAGYVDLASRFRFDFLSRYFGSFALTLFLGIVLLFVGVIGSARRSSAGKRTRLALLVFTSHGCSALSATGSTDSMSTALPPCFFLSWRPHPRFSPLSFLLWRDFESALLPSNGFTCFRRPCGGRVLTRVEL